MGIIQRQSIWGTIIAFIGVIIGFITTAIIFPRVLTSEQIGLIGILVSYAIIFSRFSSLGFNSVTNRLFPYFRDNKNKHHGFVFLALAVTTIGFLISLLVFYFLKPFIIESKVDDSLLLPTYINYLVPLIFAMLYYSIMDSYYRVLYNVVIGFFLKDILQRILILVIVILYYFKLCTFHNFVLMYVLAFILQFVILIFSLIKEKQLSLRPELSFISKDLAYSIFSVGIFGIIGGFAGSVILNVDRIMIDKFLGLSAVGIYATAFNFGILVSIPARPTQRISTAVIAESWKNNDLANIQSVYRKSCLNQFIIGILIFIGLWINVPNIFQALPAEYELGKYVIFFIGMIYLFEMATGTSIAILGTSKYYKYRSYFMTLLIILVVISNIIFIPALGIVGAALASFISRFIVFLLRYIFLLKKFGFQPYNKRFLYIILIGGFSYFIVYLIPQFDNYIIDFLIRSSIVTIIFAFLIIIFKISPEINKIFTHLIKRLKAN